MKGSLSQNVLISTGKFEKEKKYWLEKCSGELTISRFVEGPANTRYQKNKRENFCFQFNPEISDRIVSTSNGSDYGIFILILTSITYLLYRYSGNQDIIVGSQVFLQEEGDYLNSILTYRNQVQGHMTFKELLMQVRKEVMEANDHMNFPFVEILKILKNPGLELPASLIKTWVNYIPIHEKKSEQDSEWETIFNFNKNRGMIECQISCSSLNSPQPLLGVMKSLSQHLEMFFKEIFEHPDRALSQIEIMTPEEKHLLLEEFNKTNCPYPEESTIDMLFEESAKKHQGRVALIFEENVLTYKQLFDRASELGDKLKINGTRKGDIVAIMVPRSTEFVVGILGTLTVQAVCLPINIEYPEKRIQGILKDSNALYIVKQVDDESSFNDYGHHIDVKPDPRSREKKEFPEEVRTSDSLAYLIYTSGSTGKPRGVMLTHRGIINHVFTKIEELRMQKKDICCHNLSVGFVASIWQIIAPLFIGARINIYSSDVIFNPYELFKRIFENGVTVLEVVPTILNMYLGMLKEGNQESYLSELRVLVLTGEQVLPSLVNQYYEDHSIPLVNAYGQSECSDDTLHYHIPPNRDTGNVPLGTPAKNTRVVILNEEGNLQPIGVPGELSIWGDGLAIGYLNNPDITAEKFLSNPFCKGERIFRTGDLAEMNLNGEVGFLGRKDFQVKVRGIRIELGEIESNLLKNKFIKEAVVTARREAGKETYLCVYLVSDKKFSVSELREYLAKDLPEYMIPSVFIYLEKLPLTAIGKIDRSALPELTEHDCAELTGPRDDIEKKLTEVWAEVLEITEDKIGIDSNFFELGGHSLKANILILKAQKRFDKKLPLAEVFTNSTIRGLSEYIRNASLNKYDSIKPMEKKEYYQLSSTQKRLYVLQHMDLESTGYNMPQAIVLKQEYQVSQMEAAFKKIIARHESLRTSFQVVDETPVQRIHNQVEFKIETLEKVQIPVSNPRGDGILDIEDIVEYFKCSFDLQKAPLLRVGVISQENYRTILLFDLHHIISDGVSLEILEQEFLDLYSGDELKELRIHFKDFAEWQTKQEQMETKKQQEAYWVNRFSDELPVLELPTDYSRPLIRDFEGEAVNFVLTKKVTTRIKQGAKKADVTLYMALLAAYTVFLSKLSGQEDIIVGTPVASRPHPDLGKIIGMFVNTLAMRNFPIPEKTFKEYLAEVKAHTLKAYENQEYQFNELVEKISVTRDTSRNPLFDVMFNLLNQVDSTGEIPGVDDHSGHVYRKGSSKFDLNLMVIDRGERLFFKLMFSTRLFGKNTIERMVNYLKEIIEFLFANPGQRIQDVNLAPAAIKEANLSDFTSELKYPLNHKTIQEKLKESFQRNHHRIAIETGEQVVTYKELEQRAIVVRNRIKQEGVKKGSFVGIYTKEKTDVIVLMIGILNAGCGFVPIDPRLPLKRVEAMIRAPGIKIVFTDTTRKQKIRDIFRALSDEVRSIEVTDELYHPCEWVQKEATVAEYKPEDAIYIYFTSGTTGIPKAIKGKNESLVQFIDWEIKTFGVDQNIRVAQLFSMGFDAFLREVFVPLTVGGTLCIPSEEETLEEGETMANWIEQKEIQLLHCVPTLFRLLNTAPLNPVRFPHLKNVLLSGEQIRPGDLGIWFQSFGDRIQLVNLYGPTETTMVKTCYFIKSTDVKRNRIPVGQPITGCRMAILDKEMRLCDQGTVGEIYLRTPYMTHGYLSDEALNKERFIENPFLKDKKELIYKTGDLGRELVDGGYEVIGRADQQIKIRGIRIEPGEVETILLRHRNIQEAVVLPRQDEEGEFVLYAYIVSEQQLTATEIREYLSNEVPDYMIPTFFVPVESIPLTLSGKVDKKALPLPLTEPTGKRIPPGDKIERKLMEIWALILGKPENTISMDSNFFELGGHSLKATILTAKIHKAFQIRLSLADIFKTPTIEEISETIRQSESVSAYIPVNPVEKKEYYELSPVQKRMYTLQQMDPNNVSYNMPMVIPLEQETDQERLEYAFNKLIDRHESLRTAFEMVNMEAVQKIHETWDFKLNFFETNEVNQFSDALKIEEIKMEFESPFNLAKAPLLRVWLLDAGQQSMLLLNIHHIITDNISQQVLSKDFISLYSVEQLSPLRLQYKDYSEWINSRLKSKSPGMKHQENYWLEKFKEDIPQLNIPLDYERTHEHGAGLRTFTIEKTVLKQLRLSQQKNEVTLFMILLSLYNVLLSILSRQEEIIVGTFVAGRSHAELEEIVGIFVNTLVLKNQPQKEMTFIEFLGQVKENALEAIENQDYPYNKIVEKVLRKREPGRNPLFDAAFSYFSREHQEAEGTTREPEQRARNFDLSTKFDLILQIYEEKEYFQSAFIYNARLFKETTIERYVTYFKEIIQEIVKNHSIKLGDICVSHELAQAQTNLSDVQKKDFAF
jgi:tyrocidine synthetase-3